MLKLRLSVSLCVLICALSCHVTADDQDASAFLLYCDNDIHKLILDSHPLISRTLISRIPVRPRVMDYHVKNKVLFWTDYGGNVNRAPLWQERARPSVLTGLSGTFGLGVDWIHDLIYWTYASDNQITAARLDGSMVKTVLKEESIKPYAIVLNPAEGFMFWSDQGSIPKIERCNMDGSNRKVIVNDDIASAESLAIDLDSRRVFWVDITKNYLSSSKFDGNHRRNLITQLKTPISLDIYGEYVYFVTFEANHQAVYRAFKEDGGNKYKVFDGESTLRSLKVFNLSKQSEDFNVCGANNGGCSHLCLPTSAHTFSCACPNDLIMRSDNSTCMDSDGFAVTTPRFTTHSPSTQLPVTVIQTNFTSSTEKNTNQNIDATIGSSRNHAILAVVIASLALIAMVGMMLYFRMFLLKNLASTGVVNPVYNKDAEENVYM